MHCAELRINGVPYWVPPTIEIEYPEEIKEKSITDRCNDYVKSIGPEAEEILKEADEKPEPGIETCFE